MGIDIAKTGRNLLRKIDTNYIIAALCLIACMTFSITNDTLTRKLVGTGVPIVYILFIGQMISIIISLIVLYYSYSGSIRTKYLPLHIARAIMLSVATFCSKTAITSAPIPLYLSAFIYLAIPTFNMFFATTLLGERWNNFSLLMGLSILIPVGRYLINGMYLKSILLLLFSCIVYSLLDCTNAYITRNSGYRNTLMAKIIKPQGDEEILIINFYGALLVGIMYTAYAIHALYFTSTAANWSAILHPMSCIKYIAMAALSWSIVPLLSIAFKLKKVSAIQPIKAMEPILAGSFADGQQIPRDVLSGIISFFLTSVFIIIIESRKIS